jgi:hypothetical protein
MDWFTGLSVATLVYVAFTLQLFGFLARDELSLRLLMLGGSVMYLLYYSFISDVPLWDALITNGALAVVNLIMIGVVVFERTTFSMARETAELYRLFPMLSPGQFRRLLRAGQAVQPISDQALTQSGTTPDDLYYVIEGPVTIRKGDHEAEVHGQLFIGEIAFLTGQPASASVSVGPGARYLRWNSDALKKLIDRSPKLHVALSAQFNKDLVGKVARSQPL